MKAKLALLLAALLLAAPSTANATSLNAVHTPLPRFIIKDVTNPADYNGGLLNASFADGILMIDYDKEAAEKTAQLVFHIAAEDGASMIPPGQYANLLDLAPNGLLDPAQEGAKIVNSTELTIRVDPTVKSLTMRLDTANRLHVSKRIPILWRDLEAGPIISASLWPSGSAAMGVGQKLQLTVLPAGNYTDMRYTMETAMHGTTLAVSKSGEIMAFEEGEATILLRNSVGMLLDSIDITVQREHVEHVPPEEPVYPRYRVVVPSMNVYMQNDTESDVIGVLRMNQIVSVFDERDGWLLLSYGAWVSSRYLVSVK